MPSSEMSYATEKWWRRNVGAVAAPSEQIRLKWIEGAERVCVKCGTEITNIKEQVGEVRSTYHGRRMTREIICMSCHLERSERLVKRTRQDLGLKWRPPPIC